MPRKTKPFWDRIAIADNENECWLWKQAKFADGYGNYTVNGKTMRAHRHAYELTYGPVPDGLLVCHKCDTPLCCNPTHLFLGTPQDNILDMHRKGRSASQKIAQGKHVSLTDEQVVDIRLLHTQGATYEQLALVFGVHKDIIKGIVSRRSWTHLP